jgi:imidazolonepropionase-like amidohydrolase
LVVAEPASAQAVRGQTCSQPALVVRNVNLWTRSGIVNGRDVFVRDGRVTAIEPAGRRSDPAAPSIDGTGHTLLPGLIDLHLHFTIPGGLPPGDAPRDVEGITGRQLLRSGVTSGRLHLATIEQAAALKARSASPCEPMPRMQVGGPGLSGAVQRDSGAFQGATGVDDAIAKIDKFRNAGADWVAVHNADQFAPEVLHAIAERARRVGLRLMAAGTTPEEITAALTIDPETLDYFDRTPASLYSPEILAALRARRNLVLVPTPGVAYRTQAYVRDPALLERAGNFEFLDEAARAFVLASAKKDLQSPGPTGEQRVLTLLPDKLRQLRELGLPLAVGSDAGSPLHFQAGAIWWELEAWRSMGFSHREAIAAATEVGARVLRSNEVGRLEAGSRADFVLYRGNVEAGPFDGQRVIAVAKDGVLFVENGRPTWSLSRATARFSGPEGDHPVGVQHPRTSDDHVREETDEPRDLLVAVADRKSNQCQRARPQASTDRARRHERPVPHRRDSRRHRNQRTHRGHHPAEQHRDVTVAPKPSADIVDILGRDRQPSSVSIRPSLEPLGADTTRREEPCVGAAERSGRP